MFIHDCLYSHNIIWELIWRQKPDQMGENIIITKLVLELVQVYNAAKVRFIEKVISSTRQTAISTSGFEFESACFSTPCCLACD